MVEKDLNEKAAAKKPAAKKTTAEKKPVAEKKSAAEKKPAAKKAPAKKTEEVVEKKPAAKKAPAKKSAEKVEAPAVTPVAATSMLFMAPDLPTPVIDKKRGRPVEDKKQNNKAAASNEESHVRRRTRRREGEAADVSDLPPNAVVKVRAPREVKGKQRTTARQGLDST